LVHTQERKQKSSLTVRSQSNSRAGKNQRGKNQRKTLLVNLCKTEGKLGRVKLDGSGLDSLCSPGSDSTRWIHQGVLDHRSMSTTLQNV
jgi:hypothetical protein